jgi:hypothetical protein
MAASQHTLSRFEKSDNKARSRFIDQFDNRGHLPKKARVPGCAVNEAKTVMWFPTDEEPPIIVSLDEYHEQAAGEWRHGEIPRDDDEDIPVIGFSAGETTHILNADLVAGVADAADTSVEEIMARARANKNNGGAPVLFEMPSGRVMLAPRIADADAINWRDE